MIPPPSGRGGLLQSQQRHRQCGQRGERSPQHQVSVDIDIIVDIDIGNVPMSGCCPRLLSGTFWVPRTFTKSSVTERASLELCRSYSLYSTHILTRTEDCRDFRHKNLQISLLLLDSDDGIFGDFSLKNWLLR